MPIDEMRGAIRPQVHGMADLEDCMRVFVELSGSVDNARTVFARVCVDPEEEVLEAKRAARWVEGLGAKPEDTVAGVIPTNAIMLLTAKPKTGKTFWALQIAHDIATGRPMLGEFEVKRQGPVVYFSMEDPDHLFADRITRRGMADEDVDVHVVKGVLNIGTPDGLARMLSIMEPIQPVLIIIDTARQAFGMDNWNDASEVTAKLQPVVKAVRKFKGGCSMLLVAHNNKRSDAEGGDKISGSNALQSNVDGYIILDKKIKLATGDLSGEAECDGRIDMPETFKWVMDRETCHVRKMSDDETERQAAVERGKRDAALDTRIVAAIDANGGRATAAEIAQAMQMTPQYVTRALSGAKARRRIIEAGKVMGENNRPATVWSATPDHDVFG